MKLCALLLVITFSVTLSCRNDVADPTPSPREDIRIEITASRPHGSPDEPVILHVTARNAGDTTVLLSDACPHPPHWIYDDAGTELLTQDPTDPLGCADYLPPFEPGAGWEYDCAFDGRYYSESGEQLVASPGTYTAIARLEFYRLDDERGPVRLTSEVRFTWQ